MQQNSKVEETWLRTDSLRTLNQTLTTKQIEAQGWQWENRQVTACGKDNSIVQAWLPNYHTDSVDRAYHADVIKGNKENHLPLPTDKPYLSIIPEV